jgi:nitrogen-specific signal transduction histidine kinase
VRTPDSDLKSLFHELNNQLGIILANAELLEARLPDPAQKARAEQVVASVLNAITTAKSIRAACQPHDE